MLKSFLFLLASLSVYATSSVQFCENSSYITNSWKDNRYVDNKDGTVTDKVTKLMWKKCSQGLSGDSCENGTVKKFNWEDALNEATNVNNSSVGNLSDWRVPNFKELESLVSYNCVNPSINKSIFPNTLSDFFWSSSINNSKNFPNRVKPINFEKGSGDAINDMSEKYFLRLVRTVN